MKAIVTTEYGTPDVLRLTDIAKPTPKDKEVLVKVFATTVNRTDCGFLSGMPLLVRLFSGLRRPKNPVLGNEFAGEIEHTGKDVTLFKQGDRVFGYNDVTFGAHAQYMVVTEDGAIATMPENSTFSECAPLIEGAHYALCDIRAAKVTADQRVLINGATGAIGSAAVQLVKELGAHVTAVCDTRNLTLVKSLGADVVIDYTAQDFTKLNEQFDLVFDAVGKRSFGECKRILKSKGIYISTELGYKNQNPFLAMITPLMGGKKLLFPIPTISKEDVVFLKTLMERGAYKPVIDRTYPLEETVAAYKYVLTGQKTGNVIITVSHN